jgi:hypothetical protein
MSEEYEEGTYLHEFTEAGRGAIVRREAQLGGDVSTSGSNARAAAVGVGVAVPMMLVMVVVLMFGLLITFAIPPFGCCIGPLLMIGAACLLGGIGGGVAQVAGGDATARGRVPASARRLPGGLWGECPYCGHPRSAKRKEGDRLACGRCLNVFVVRGSRFYVPEDRLKKFRKKNLASTSDV